MEAPSRRGATCEIACMHVGISLTTGFLSHYSGHLQQNCSRNQSLFDTIVALLKVRRLHRSARHTRHFLLKVLLWKSEQTGTMMLSESVVTRCRATRHQLRQCRLAAWILRRPSGLKQGLP